MRNPDTDGLQTTDHGPRTSLRRFVSVVALFTLTLASTLTLAAEETRKSYDLPAGDAAATLKRFAEISGRETLFAAEVVRGVRTQPVKGSLTAQEALDAMLADSGLVATTDAKTGAFAVRRGDPDPNAARAAQTAGVRPVSQVKVEHGVVNMGEFEVVGTKIDGLNNKGLLQNGVDGALYHDVVTRADIERMGVTSVEELFRIMPATSSPRSFFTTNELTGGITGGVATRFSTMGLRGFDSTQTVVLINGRALPRSAESSGADLSRIPLSAIERVEIMPFAGSAIYGAGAIGGAINVILRKNYSGQEVTLYAGTSTDGGAGEYRFTFLDGRTFSNGKGRLTTTVTHHHRDPLRANQRDYLARAAAKFTPANRALLNVFGQTPFEGYLIPAFASAPAVIVASNSINSAVNDLGIPGAPGVRWATVPSGTSPAASFALTPASFTATAGRVNSAGQPTRYDRLVLYEPIDTYSANAQLEYDFLPDGKLSAYAELTGGFNRKDYSFPQGSSVNLSATDPMNPFRTNVTPGFVGRPVTVHLTTPDLAEARAKWNYESARAVVGLKGKATERIEWSVDGAVDYTRHTVTSDNPPNNMLILSALSPFVPGGSLAPADVRRALYPLLADHTQFPVSAQVRDNYFGSSIRFIATRALQKEGNARVTADVFDLPAGPLRASVLGRYQEWDGVTGSNLRNVPGFIQMVYGSNPFQSLTTSSKIGRSIWQMAGEVSLPVIGEKWRPLPIESLELQASFSTEENTSTRPGSADSVQRGNTGVVAVKVQPIKDLSFRVSYSEGFFPPNWSSLMNAPSVGTQPTGVVPDPQRGNTVQTTPFVVIAGGNPNLRPERAESLNMGLILTPRFLPGFRLSVDYWQIEKFDAIQSTSFFTVLGNPQVYGPLITRAAPTPAEQALGWAGVVTQIMSLPVNVALTKTEGFDLRGHYEFKTETWGSFELNSNASFTNFFLSQPIAGAPTRNTAGGSGPVRWRGNGSVTWNVKPWTVTLSARYIGHFSSGTTTPSPSYANAIPFDGGRIPAFMHYDLQATYEVKSRLGERGWRSWLAGTKWTLGANNVLNTEPDMATGVGEGFFAGQTFYNMYDDPRQRFVYLSVQKSL